mmetsp:Transcript_16589/g.23465  ORF Transcript_16589/g.23465 Transcript_16589/m.23465 type:complete len:844 (+) Transcript_16589:69-2600(+)
MNANDSASATDDVPPSKDGTSSPSPTAKESKDAPPQSKRASAPRAPQSFTSPTTSDTAAAAKKHSVNTEVPKFRFVSIAKKSAGYSSAAAGTWVEGKSSKELAGKYEGPDNRVASIYDRDASEKVVVGKLNNMAERQAVVGDDKKEVDAVDKKVDAVIGSHEDEEQKVEEKDEVVEKVVEEVEKRKKKKNKKVEEEVVQPAIQEDVAKKSSSEEKDLEAAVPVATQTKVAVPSATQNKIVTHAENTQSSSVDTKQGNLYCSDSGEHIATALPTTPRNEDANKQDSSDSRRRRCSTKNRILSVILLLFLATVGVLGYIFATKQSEDDASSGLRGDAQKNKDDTSSAMDAPTQSPNSPSASFNEPTLKPTEPSAPQGISITGVSMDGPQSCIIGSLAGDECLEEPKIRQQLFIPRGGENPVNINFGHSVAFINDNILAAATDGSGSDAGVHIYFRDNLNLYAHNQSIFDGDEQSLFGHSIAASKKTNTLVVGAPSLSRRDEEVDCVQEWCELCSWSEFDSTPCGERLDVIVQQSSNGNEEEIKQQIMSSGRCIVDVICNDVISQGKVFVYEPKGSLWEQAGMITSDDPSFGSVVAIEGDIIAIGSPDEDKVRIYEKDDNSWILIDTKSPPSQTIGARFGSSLSLSEGILVIGAPLDGIGGAAYVYARSFGRFVQQEPALLSRDINPGDNFGEKVSVSGCTIAVSSSNAKTASAIGTGVIRIFNYDPLVDLYREYQIIEPIEEVDGVFPECLVMEENNLLVGSSGGGSFSTGIVTHFVRRNSGWTQQAVIPNPLVEAGGSAAGGFGCGMSISESTALVGAKGTEQGRPGSFVVADLCPEAEEEELI